MKLSYYKKDLIGFYKNQVYPKSSVIEYGNTHSYIKQALGIRGMKINDKYDYVLLVDSINNIDDIQDAFHKIRKLCTSDTRIILNYFNGFWLPIIQLAEFLRLKDQQPRKNWLNSNDIHNLLELEQFQVIKKGSRLLCPIYIPILSSFFNKYIANLPFFDLFCFTQYIVAKPLNIGFNRSYKVSIIIPSRNEAGNIENAIKGIPNLGSHIEIIFVEGHSKDDTWKEIKRVAKKYRDKDIKYFQQKGVGKADAVRLGFKKATGDILMILDADLTVDPTELIKFYNAYSNENGEFINGSRLVYPLEKDSMQMLNIWANKFFSLVFSWVLNQPIKDTLCGTKVISKVNYQKLVANRKHFGDFDPFGDFDLLFGASKLNLKYAEVPIKYKSRVYGSTNISRFKHGWLLLKMVLFSLNRIKFV